MKVGSKLAIWIISAAILIAALSSYFHYLHTLQSATRDFEARGREIAEITEVSLTNIMLVDLNREVLQQTLDAIVGMEPIDGILIINREGVASMGVPEDAVGTARMVEWQRPRGYYDEDRSAYHWIQPIKNREPCQRCHNPEHEFTGAIAIDFSTESLHKGLRFEAIEGFGFAFGAVGVVVVLVLILSKNMVSNRLEAVVNQIQRVRDGNYGASVQVSGTDEISDLSMFFNEMAGSIRSREEEKELLFKQISKSYEIWQSTFDSITDMIAVVDEDFNIMMANKSFMDYFGVARDDMTKKKCYEIFYDIDSPHQYCPHLKVLSSNKPGTMEFRRAGTDRILHMSLYPYHHPELDFKGTIHAIKDVTDEKENEMRLIMSERLAALGEMASGLAHEINNPLASIAGCTEGLMNRVKKSEYDPEFFKEYLGIMEEEILRCKHITTNMLSFVRQTSATQEKEIGEILDRTVDIIGLQGRLKNVEIVKDYGKNIAPILTNESELRQVFMAVITNALDAMKDSGTLTLGTAAEDGSIVVEISDTGPGIPEHFIDRIFDPFFTTKVESGGTGLGLSIARKIITASNGDMKVFCEEGKRTTVRITLPSMRSE